jgi:uncharacterized protein
MAAQAITLIVCCAFAGLLGFAAHRASICTVRAVAEILSARTAFMLASIGKSALWVIALTLPFLWLAPGAAPPIGGWQLTATALAGGLLFGIGAAINGGCAYSTMTRLVDGEVRMAISIGGFAIGVAVYAILGSLQWIARPQAAPPLIGRAADYVLVPLLLLLAWSLYEVARVWRTRTKHLRLRDLMLATQYRLSGAAILIGVSGTAIFLLLGSPGYTITLQTIVQGFIGLGALPSGTRVLLLAAVLAGMAASTWQRGSFRLDWRPQLSWLRNLCGGALMGFGTALLPGGNDALVLYGIPSFSPHALPGFAALLLGAALGLLAMKHLAGLDTRVVCRNDIYRAEAQPATSFLNSHAPRGQKQN